MIKVYIASGSKLTNDCGELAQALEDRGWEITRKWWKQYVKTLYDNKSEEEFYAMPVTQIIQKLDFRAIDEADIVIVLCNYKTENKDNLNTYVDKVSKLTEDEFVHNIESRREFHNHGAARWAHKRLTDANNMLYGVNAPLTGALIEAGYAMAKNKIVIFYGQMKRSAMVSGAIHCKTTQQLNETLDKVTTH